MHRLFTGRQLILIPILVALEYGLSSILPYGTGRPDLLSLMVLDAALFSDFQKAPFLALAVGLFRDFIGGHLFGIETLSLSLTALALYFGMLKLERDSFWVRGGVTLSFVLAAQLISVLLGISLETSQKLNAGLIGGIFWTTVYTLAAAPGFFWFTNRWFHRTPFLKQYELFH